METLGSWDAARITKDAPKIRAVTERNLKDPLRLAHREELARAFLEQNVVNRKDDYTIGMIEVEAGGKKILFLSVSGSFYDEKIADLTGYLGTQLDTLPISTDIDELRLITSAGETARTHYRFDFRRGGAQGVPYECSEITLAAEIKKVEQDCKKNNLLFFPRGETYFLVHPQPQRRNVEAIDSCKDCQDNKPFREEPKKALSAPRTASFRPKS